MLAFYVGYEEYQIQQEALVYDLDDPNRYWSMRVEGGFMNAVARKNAMQMALHDELFYQMFWSHQKLLYQSADCGNRMTVHRTAVCNAGSC